MYPAPNARDFDAKGRSPRDTLVVETRVTGTKYSYGGMGASDHGCRDWVRGAELVARHGCGPLDLK